LRLSEHAPRARRARAAPPANVPRLGADRDFALGLTFVLLAFVGLVWAFAPHTVDDAWVAFRYSRQWAAGHGPYYNPGEHVEGYSNFLLVLLLTPVIRYAGPEAALPVAKAIGPAMSAQRAPAAARRASRAAPRIASRPEARPMAFATGSAASGPA
jgi:arabinofuranosyltransferase